MTISKAAVELAKILMDHFSKLPPSEKAKRQKAFSVAVAKIR